MPNMNGVMLGQLQGARDTNVDKGEMTMEEQAKNGKLMKEVKEVGELLASQVALLQSMRLLQAADGSKACIRRSLVRISTYLVGRYP